MASGSAVHSDVGSESDSHLSEPNPPKKHCPSASIPSSSSSSRSSTRKYNKQWELTFPWLEFDENLQGAFCKVCKKNGRSLQRIGGAWISKPFCNWKKATQKMRAHSQSETHLLSCQVEVEGNRARKQGSASKCK